MWKNVWILLTCCYYCLGFESETVVIKSLPAYLYLAEGDDELLKTKFSEAEKVHRPFPQTSPFTVMDPPQFLPDRNRNQSQSPPLHPYSSSPSIGSDSDDELVHKYYQISSLSQAVPPIFMETGNYKEEMEIPRSILPQPSPLPLPLPPQSKQSAPPSIMSQQVPPPPQPLPMNLNQPPTSPPETLPMCPPLSLQFRPLPQHQHNQFPPPVPAPAPPFLPPVFAKKPPPLPPPLPPPRPPPQRPLPQPQQPSLQPSQFTAIRQTRQSQYQHQQPLSQLQATRRNYQRSKSKQPRFKRQWEHPPPCSKQPPISPKFKHIRQPLCVLDFPVSPTYLDNLSRQKQAKPPPSPPAPGNDENSGKELRPPSPPFQIQNEPGVPVSNLQNFHFQHPHPYPYQNQYQYQYQQYPGPSSYQESPYSVPTGPEQPIYTYPYPCRSPPPSSMAPDYPQNPFYYTPYQSPPYPPLMQQPMPPKFPLDEPPPTEAEPPTEAPEEPPPEPPTPPPHPLYFGRFFTKIIDKCIALKLKGRRIFMETFDLSPKNFPYTQQV